MALRILLFICTITLYTSCSSTGKITADSDSPRLVFGSGGGFTGAYTTYELNADRYIFALLPDNTKHQVKRISKNQAKALFTQAEKLSEAQPTFNYPGNITKYIKYHSDNKVVEYKWGDPDMQIPYEITDFYNQLNDIVKKNMNINQP